MKLNIKNEFDRLTDVLVASAETYFDHKAINNNQEIYYRECPPQKHLLVEQQKHFFEVLREMGVNLIFAKELIDCPDQLNTRDPSFVIGNTFFVSSMKESLRAHEKDGLADIILQIGSNIEYLDDCTIEGGDIMVCDNVVYVGISRRTTIEGARKLEGMLNRKYKVEPIYLKPGFLHLDTVFNVIDKDLALTCLEAIENSSAEFIKDYFDVIDISLEEQLNLGTNVLVVSPHKVISQISNKRINDELRKKGFSVIELAYSEAAKLGGAFRCSTCPLVRE